jgi:hypothetical protein
LNSLRRLNRRLRRNIRCGGGSVFVRQRFFTGFEICLLLCETLFLGHLMLGRETLLHLPFYFRLLLLLGLLFLAGNKNARAATNGKMQNFFIVKLNPKGSSLFEGNGVAGRLRDRRINQRPGDAAADVAVGTGVIVTRSILSRRTFWTFA